MKKIISLFTLICLLTGINLIDVFASSTMDEIILDFEKTVINEGVFFTDSTLINEIKPFGNSITHSGEMSIEPLATEDNSSNKALYISAESSAANFRIDPDMNIDLSDARYALAVDFDFYIDGDVSRNGNIFLPFVRLRNDSAGKSSYYYVDKNYKLTHSGDYAATWLENVTIESDKWYNVRYLAHPDTGGFYYINGNLVAYDNVSFNDRYSDYVQIQLSSGAGACYIDDLYIGSTNKLPTINFEVSEFTPGVTKVGERVKFTATDSFSSGEEVEILYSTDRINWNVCADVTDNIASVPAKEQTTYYKAVVIADNVEVRYSDVIGIYGIAENKFEKLEKVVDNLNFENQSPDSLFDISTGTLCLNGSVWKTLMGEKFLSDANFSSIVVQPDEITNKKNGKCLKLTYTDNTPAYTAVTLMLPLKMKTESESIKSGVCKSGTVVVEYDFATSQIGLDHVGGLRFEGANYFYLNLTSQGKFKFNGTVLDTTYNINTWYRIKFVIDLDNQLISLYIDENLAGSAEISDEILDKGLESFRIICDTKANTGQVFFDNFDAYLAGDNISEPVSPNIDFKGVRYVIDDEISYSMGDGNALDVYAVISNSGVEDNCVCIFPLYDEKGYLVDVEMRDVIFREGETLITLEPVTFENITEDMSIKMLLWDLMK